MGSRLITDVFVRRLFQGIVLGGLVGLFLVQLLFIIFVVGRHAGWFSGVPTLEPLIIGILEFPFGQEFSALAAVLAGVIPIVVSTVCYKVDQTAKQSIDELNQTGRLGVTALMAGILAGLCAVAIGGLYAQDVALMIGAAGPDAAPRVAIRNTLSAILGFQAIYSVQLLGLKK